ncbi:MAG: hypothetical protein IPI67_12695 [Myxococcales bacterium]|nr:hypothetical protein [Myxococcales bacterium]
MRLMTSTIVLSLAIVSAVALTNCKKKDSGQDAQSGFQQGQSGGPYGSGGGPGPGPTAAAPDAGSPAPCQPGQPCQPQPGQVPALGSVGNDPNALQAIIAGALAGGAATFGLLTGGETSQLEAGIKMKAQTDAKGKRPDGQLMTAKLQQDGHAEAMFTLPPNSCFTFVGFGNPGVFNYQINILTAPPMPPQVLAQSGAGGVDPTVGPNDQCVRNPYPTALPVKIDMHVLKGQGLVGVQAYKK